MTAYPFVYIKITLRYCINCGFVSVSLINSRKLIIIVSGFTHNNVLFYLIVKYLSRVNDNFVCTGSPVPFELTPFIGVLVIVGTLLLVSAIVIIGALKRSQTRGSIARPQALPIKDKAALPLRSHVQDLYDMDDKNPDLIPCNKGTTLFLIISILHDLIFILYIFIFIKLI